MKNGWTGGQYSLFRFVFGVYLFVLFVRMIPGAPQIISPAASPDASSSPLTYFFPNLLALSDAPLLAQSFLAFAAAFAVLFALGIFDRTSSIALVYLGACIFGRNPLLANPGLPFVAWMLLAHAFLPPAPYGSWARRSLADPGSQWRMPPPIFAAAWILLAFGYFYSGLTTLLGPFSFGSTSIIVIGPQILFAPLALFKRLRPILWTTMLAIHLCLMLLLIDSPDLNLINSMGIGFVMLHLFAFNPDWIPPKRAASASDADTDASDATGTAPSQTELIFYDGYCGLCHRAVRFALSEDSSGTAFRYAPLQGETFLRAVPESDRAGLPDSIVVQTADGQLLTRSSGIIHIAKRLGGIWRVGAALGQGVPSIFRDAGYRFVAHIRHRLFRRPDETCPILPPHLRQRFDP